MVDNFMTRRQRSALTQLSQLLDKLRRKMTVSVLVDRNIRGIFTNLRLKRRPMLQEFTCIISVINGQECLHYDLHARRSFNRGAAVVYSRSVEV